MAKQQKQQSADEIWIQSSELASLASISDRVARRIAEKGHTKLTHWRGSTLTVRTVHGIGGTAGKKYELLLSSLPEQLQIAWLRKQPFADLREQVAVHQTRVEEDRRAGGRKNRERFINLPWIQDEREVRHAAFTRLPTSMQEEAKRRFRTVLRFHEFDGSDVPQKQRYSIVSKEAGVSPETLRNWVGACRNLDQGDWCSALAPKYRGCQVNAPFDEDAYTFVKAEYFTQNKPSLKAVYRRAEIASKGYGWTLPSYSAVKRRVEAEPQWFQVLMREGMEALLKMYPAQERNYSNLSVHEIWGADGRKADVFVKFEDGTVDRPIVAAWLDVRSRFCVGYAIGKTESLDLVRAAFKNALDKMQVIPNEVLLDNGRGFASKFLTGGAPTRFRFAVRKDDVPGIFTLMGIKIHWALPYNGRAKPIESFWRTFAEMDKRFLHAYCGNTPDARPENFDKNKAVPIEQFKDALEETLTQYHQREHRGHAMNGRSPLKVYQDLLSNSVPRQPSQEQLRLCLLAAEKVTLHVDDRSIRINGNRYWTEKLTDLPRNIHYVARFDPENSANPIAVYRGEQFVCEAPLIERTGFKDRQAAKDHARGLKGFKKGRKQVAQAILDMDKARAWIKAPGQDGTSKAVADAITASIPKPNIVRPLRPTADYRKNWENPRTPTQEEMRQALFAHARRQGGKR